MHFIVGYYTIYYTSGIVGRGRVEEWGGWMRCHIGIKTLTNKLFINYLFHQLCIELMK